MKKVSKFLKNYGFYLAISVICIGALVAIFTLPNKEGNITDQANPYAKNETADGSNLAEGKDFAIIDEDSLDDANNETEDIAQDVPATDNEVASSPSTSPEATPKSKGTNNEVAANTPNTSEEVKPDTFESTTASVAQEPFFAEGDTFVWPADGKVLVPYTDENTTHWYSESLNQTMRTFGICVGGEAGTQVKAVAKGTVTEIVDDSSDYLKAGMPYVGKLMVVDLGNGYVSLYGFQGGTPNEDLLGQVVNAGDVLGTMGSPKGAFISEGSNIYLQVMHNDKIVNPLNFLTTDTAVKEDGIDVGFAK